MSAFACNEAHIGQLAIRFAENNIRLGSAQPDAWIPRIAQEWAYALAWANINALIERYDEHDAEFLVGCSFTDYVAGCVQASRCVDYSLRAIDIIRMAQCYDYQACEYFHYRNATFASQSDVGACHVNRLISDMIRSCLVITMPFTTTTVTELPRLYGLPDLLSAAYPGRIHKTNSSERRLYVF